MSRGRYPRRLKTRIPDKLIADRYLDSWSSRALYYHPERFPRVNSGLLFGNPHPLVLEVGCGTGDFLCTLAGLQPEINFLGIEIVLKPLYRAVETAHGMDLGNIRFVQADIRRLYPLFVPNSLLMICIHFPVPNKKKKHEIFNREFLKVARLALVPGGRISLRTDDSARFIEMSSLAVGHPGFREVPTAQQGRLKEDKIRSHNQVIWESRGRVTRSFELEKVA